MMHRFVDDAGRRWHVETRGGSDAIGVRSVSVWFIDEMTGWRLYGGLHSVDVEKTTDQRLRQTLQGAFTVLLDGKPMVVKRHNEPTEMFHINDDRYVRHVQEPAKAGGGWYAATNSLVKFDETALREELGQLAFTADQVNAAIALARLMYVRS